MSASTLSLGSTQFPAESEFPLYKASAEWYYSDISKDVDIIMDIAETFRALGDPARLKIVSMVAEAGELCVCKIVEDLDMMGQPAVSHHLSKLRYSGLLRARKQGQWVYYSLNVDVLEDGALAFLKSLAAAARSVAAGKKECCR
jgi:ArsR family transcriptional regulator, arsenate/arsenite/antimonite-responsive transcriptional repressor